VPGLQLHWNRRGQCQRARRLADRAVGGPHFRLALENRLVEAVFSQNSETPAFDLTKFRNPTGLEDSSNE
jgi:hypothetical protein